MRSNIRTVLGVAVGYRRALARVATELPAVEWTLHAVAQHSSTRSQVSAHVRTVGVERVHLTVLTPEHRQVQSCTRQTGDNNTPWAFN